MLVIRVEAESIEDAQPLAEELIGLFGDESVSLQDDGELEVRPRNGQANGALERTLGAVAAWLSDSRIDSTDVWVNDRPYRVDREALSTTGA